MLSSVDERGANLSVGERQLIAFARILAFNPDILILDEATANIDSESEHIIQEATKEITKGHTSIIIAHRLSTVEQCDRIIVLNQGETVEMGSHQELMKARGLLLSIRIGRSEIDFDRHIRSRNCRAIKADRIDRGNIIPTVCGIARNGLTIDSHGDGIHNRSFSKVYNPLKFDRYEREYLK